MKFCCPLIDVKDIQASRSFYETVMRQKLALDLGTNLSFGEDGPVFAIQLDFTGLVGADGLSASYKGNDHELVFEEGDYDEFEEHIKQFNDIVYLHRTKEYPWGQRVMRFYDPDFHIIEVGESMESVFKKFWGQGMDIDEVAQRTGHPVDFVKRYINCSGQ